MSIYLTNQLYTGANAPLTGELLTAYFTEAIDETDLFYINIVSEILGGFESTTLANIVVIPPEERLAEREDLEWKSVLTVTNEVRSSRIFNRTGYNSNHK